MFACGGRSTETNSRLIAGRSPHNVMIRRDTCHWCQMASCCCGYCTYIISTHRHTQRIHFGCGTFLVVARQAAQELTDTSSVCNDVSPYWESVAAQSLNFKFNRALCRYMYKRNFLFLPPPSIRCANTAKFINVPGITLSHITDKIADRRCILTIITHSVLLCLTSG